VQDPCLGLGEIGDVVVEIIEGITKILSTLIDSCCLHQCCGLLTTIIESSSDLLDTLLNTEVGVSILENICGLSEVLSSCLNYFFRDFAWRALDIICTHLECTVAAPCPCLWPLMCTSQLASALGIALGSTLLPISL
jgi:hypothetical protein